MNKIVPNQSLKRTGPSMANASVSAAKKQSREKVEILEDAWLESLKLLTCPKWSKMRLVTRQLNGLVQRNVSRLPLATIDRVEMRLEQRDISESKMIASDSPILSDQKIQWFKDRGVTLNVLEGIELNTSIIGVDLKEKRSIDLVIHVDKKNFNARVLFETEFSPHRNPYSWPAMTHFLKLVYDPSTYVEELSMYAIDNKLKEFLFSDEEKRYIRCRSFNLQVIDGDESCESVSWLEQNIQADKIEIPEFTDYDDEKICDVISNFLLGSSWISANQVVNLGHVNELKNFFRALIKKFQTMSAVQSTFPIILFSGTRFIDTEDDLEIKCLLSGKGELEDLEDDEYWEYLEGGDESGDDRDGKTYTISNGANRMRVEFMKPPPRGPYAFKCSGSRPCAFDIRVTLEAGE